MTSNRIISKISSSGEHHSLGIIDCLDSSRSHRVRNTSCSASSTMSSTSSCSSSALSASNLNENFLIDVLVVFPNGFQIAKKLDSRKAVYDILIELSATAKLIPTNYTLKLFSKDETNSNNKNNNVNDNDLYKLIEYTPNQTIAQLNPARINILPKTTTLKHQQLQSLTSTCINLSNQTSTSSLHLSKQAPFELTTRVQANLPFNQKTAVRVKTDILLDDLFDLICKEAALDRSRYDLVIIPDQNDSQNGQKTVRMQDSLANYSTREVTLVLKNSNLNSKSTHSIFTQNTLNKTSARSTHQSKNNYYNQHSKTNSKLTKLDENSKARSKSELDLSTIISQSDLSTISNESKHSKNFKGSTSNLSTKSSQKTTSSMFSFFTRKKNTEKSKSKTQLNQDETARQKSATLKPSINTNLDDTQSTVSSTLSSNNNRLNESTHYLTQFKNKKKQAPAPPVPSLKSVQEQSNENREPFVNKETRVDKTRSKSEILDRNTLIKELDLDKEALEKIINLTKKKKKVAPPPPPAQTQTLIEKSQKEALSVITNLSPKSNDSREDFSENVDEKKIIERSEENASSSPPSFPSPSLSEVSSTNDTNTSCSNSNSNQFYNYHLNERQNLVIAAQIRVEQNDISDFKRQPSIQSNITENDESIAMNQSSNSANLFKQEENEKSKANNDNESINECSLTSSISNNTNEISRNSSLATVDVLTKSFANAISIGEKCLDEQKESQTEKDAMTKSTNSKSNDDSLIIPNGHSVKSFYGAVVDNEFSDVDSVRTYNSPIINSPLNLEQNYQTQNLPSQATKIVIQREYLTPKFDHNNNANNLKINMSPLKLETRIPDVLVEASQTSLSSYSNENDYLNKEVNDINSQAESLSPVKELIKQTALIEIRPEFETSVLLTQEKPQEVVFRNIEKNFDTNNKRSTLPLSLSKSPSSPPPQFPAIGENEINELHPNYTVVRSGDIIEKNGIYYSTDGTIRGYSGIVKRLANSKALNEVFMKQQELEQQHEREYELELQEQQEQALKENSLKQTPKPTSQYSTLSQSRPRASIGNIVANEKKISNSNLSFSNQNIYRTAPAKKIPIEANNKQTLEDELSKKLENRRMTMAQQIAQNKLEIDTNVKPSSSCSSSSVQSSSSSSSCTSPSQNSPNNIFLNQKLKNTQKINTPSPSFVMSAKVRSEPNQSIVNSNSFNNNNFTTNSLSHSSSRTSLTLDQINQNKCSLLNELKSIVPVLELNNEQTNPAPSNIPAPPPPPPIMNLTSTPTQKQAPLVAPKNFDSNTIQSINKKNQIINAREDLLESIKGFSISTLKKINKEETE